MSGGRRWKYDENFFTISSLKHIHAKKYAGGNFELMKLHTKN